MGESDRKEEPKYMIVLDRIYQKGPAVAYPNLPHSSEDLITMTPDQRREQDLQREMVSHDIPRDKDLLPISSLADYEISQAIESLKRVGLVKETDRINGIRRDSDLINYIKLTKEGFEVAHDRELRQRQQEISERVADLTEQQSRSSSLVAWVTGVIGITAVFQAITAMVSLSWPQSSKLVVVYTIVILSGWWIALNRMY